MSCIDPESAISPSVSGDLEGAHWQAPGPEADTAQAAGITDLVPGRILRLWIDLVSQAEGRVLPSPQTHAEELTEQEFGALDYLQGRWRTLAEMSSAMGVSDRTCSSIANRLTALGAAKHSHNSLDQRLTHLVSTAAGSELSRDHRRHQVATLEWLLGQSETARRAVLIVAMRQLGGSPRVPDPIQPLVVLAHTTAQLPQPGSLLPTSLTGTSPGPGPLSLLDQNLSNTRKASSPP